MRQRNPLVSFFTGLVTGAGNYVLARRARQEYERAQKEREEERAWLKEQRELARKDYDQRQRDRDADTLSPLVSLYPDRAGEILDTQRALRSGSAVLGSADAPGASFGGGTGTLGTPAAGATAPPIQEANGTEALTRVLTRRMGGGGPSPDSLRRRLLGGPGLGGPVQPVAGTPPIVPATTAATGLGTGLQPGTSGLNTGLDFQVNVPRQISATGLTKGAKTASEIAFERQQKLQEMKNQESARKQRLASMTQLIGKALASDATKANTILRQRALTANNLWLQGMDIEDGWREADRRFPGAPQTDVESLFRMVNPDGGAGGAGGAAPGTPGTAPADPLRTAGGLPTGTPAGVPNPAAPGGVQFAPVTPAPTGPQEPGVKTDLQPGQPLHANPLSGLSQLVNGGGQAPTVLPADAPAPDVQGALVQGSFPVNRFPVPGTEGPVATTAPMPRRLTKAQSQIELNQARTGQVMLQGELTRGRISQIPALTAYYHARTAEILNRPDREKADREARLETAMARLMTEYDAPMSVWQGYRKTLGLPPLPADLDLSGVQKRPLPFQEQRWAVEVQRVLSDFEPEDQAAILQSLQTGKPLPGVSKAQKPKEPSFSERRATPGTPEFENYHREERKKWLRQQIDGIDLGVATGQLEDSDALREVKRKYENELGQLLVGAPAPASGKPAGASKPATSTKPGGSLSQMPKTRQEARQRYVNWVVKRRTEAGYSREEAIREAEHRANEEMRAGRWKDLPVR